MIYNPHPYQDFCTKHIIANLYSALFVDMGLGKTVATLTAIDQLIYDDFEVQKVLVISPKLVAEKTWSAEIEKWGHLSRLKLSKVLGSEAERKTALKCSADVYVINRENASWLVGYYGTAWPFDMVVIDELSSFKSAKSIRFKALKSIRPKIKRVVGLTGTPAPNSLIDLWPQLYLLDMGERLGKNITAYREAYFKQNTYTPFSKYELAVSEKVIYEKIRDICVSMKAEDYLQLPKRIDNTISLEMPESLRKQYKEFEREQILELLNDKEITAVNAAALTNKLLQFANGAVYDEKKLYHEVHDLKLEKVMEDIEAMNGEPVLLFYQYRHDLERLQQRLKKDCKEIKDRNAIEDWNKRKIPVLLAHAASAGHGLNLQHGGNYISWYGLPWSLELYQQAVARLDRQGQIKPVVNRRYVMTGTMEEKVLSVLESKADGQDRLMSAVKALIKEYQNVV